MTAWSEWETLRRQVVAAGWILDKDGARLRGADVSAVQALQQQPGNPGSAGDEGRSISAHLKTDGLYFFLNLPDGRYKLRGCNAQGAPTEEKAIHVRRQSNEKPDLQRVDLELSGRPKREGL
jgi:hypothetical protein